MSEGKDKKSKATKKNKDLKGPAVTQLIMSMHRKDEKEEYEALGN